VHSDAHTNYKKVRTDVSFHFEAKMSTKQDALLSQRDRATLHVIEYFAKSLEIIRNDSVE